MVSTLQWKRAKIEEMATSTHQVWESKCGGYRVVKRIPKVHGLEAGFFAMRLRVTFHSKMWVSVENDQRTGQCLRYKTKGRAEDVCEAHNDA